MPSEWWNWQNPKQNRILLHRQNSGGDLMKINISALAIVLLLCSVYTLAPFNQDRLGTPQALTLMSYGEYKGAQSWT